MGKMAENTARTNAMMKELGYESGGEFKNLFSSSDMSDRISALEDSFSQFVKLSTQPTPKSAPDNQVKASPPTASSSSINPMPTSQSDPSDTTMIVNVSGGSNSSPSLPVAPQEGQTTSTYVREAYGAGLAFSILSSSPWGN